MVVHPDGSWTVVEIKSFPMLDGAADPAKVGAAARQAAVYVLALERVAERLDPPPRVRHRVLLVCPKDFSNLPTASAVDVRKQRAVTARQLARLTRIEEIADTLPEGVCFSPNCPPSSSNRPWRRSRRPTRRIASPRASWPSTAVTAPARPAP